jgi:hypothetical protein
MLLLLLSLQQCARTFQVESHEAVALVGPGDLAAADGTVVTGPAGTFALQPYDTNKCAFFRMGIPRQWWGLRCMLTLLLQMALLWTTKLLHLPCSSTHNQCTCCVIVSSALHSWDCDDACCLRWPGGTADVQPAVWPCNSESSGTKQHALTKLQVNRQSCSSSSTYHLDACAVLAGRVTRRGLRGALVAVQWQCTALACLVGEAMCCCCCCCCQSRPLEVT